MLRIFSFVINRKLLLFLLAVIININICFCQKDLLFENIPSWVTPTSYSNIVEDTISTGGGHYYLLIERQYNTERKEIFRRYATKILSEKGLQTGSSISESFDPTFNSLIFHSIIIKRNGLIINKLDPKKFELIRREENLERHVYDGSLTAILNVENVLPGDIIEYAYTIRGQNPLFNGKFFNSFYLNYDVPVGKIYYSILTESSRSLQFKYFNTTKIIDQKTNGSHIIYSWIEENVKALTSDDGAPNWYNPNTRFEVSEFKSNVELNDWAKSLFYISELSRKPIQEKINEIKSKYKQPEEQIGKTIQFVQDEIRYLSISNGISGYKPHPPDQVFNQRFGDCKDKSLLLVTMLKLLKVESTPVLVNSEYGKYLNQSLPSPKNFDHCIIQLNYEDSLYWIDPTITYQRGKMEELHLPSYFNGLVIGSGSSELTPIPFGYHKSNITINENYVLNEVGTSATLDVLTTYSGDEAITMRSYRQANSQDEINKGYLNFYATDHPTILSVSDVTFNDDEEKNLITTHEKYKIESYWLYDSTTSQYKADVYPRLITTYFKIPTTKIRKSPYSLSYPLTIDHFIKVNLPESWKIEDRSKKIESPGFHYRSSILYTDQVIRFKYCYQTKKESLEAGEVTEYIEKTNKIYDDMSFQLTYSKGASTSSSTEFNWQFFIIMLIAMAISTWLLILSLRYNPEPQFHSEVHHQIGGWLIVFAIGLVLTPIILISGFVSNEYFNPVQWQILANASFSAYNPLLGALVVFEMIGSIFLIWFSILSLVLFFQRRTSAPRVIVVFYSAYLGFLFLDNIGAKYFNLFSEKETMNNFKEIGKMLVRTAIWIPYLLIAERVKGTFVKRL